MHPELLSLSLFMLVTSCSPGPNNIVASYSGFNFGLKNYTTYVWSYIWIYNFSDSNEFWIDKYF